MHSATQATEPSHYATIRDDRASSSSSCSSSALPAVRPPSTVRDVLLKIIRKRYPSFRPRNDYDIFILSGSRAYRGPESGLYTWLDGELARQLAVLGSIEDVIQTVQEMLDSTEIVTGVCISSGLPIAPHVDVSTSTHRHPGQATA